jgi:RNA polymerase sigma-70 factor, ECF subfamily
MTVGEHELRWAEAMRAERRGDAIAYERMLKEVAVALRRSLSPRLVHVGLGGHEAEDLVQEILIGLHSKRHTWDSERPFVPWLHAITRYKLIDFTRHRRRETRRRVDLPLEDWLELVQSPSDEATLNAGGG